MGARGTRAAQATFPIGGARLTGSYDDVRIDNLAHGQGTIDGFFTQSRIGSATADGAGLAFNLADNARQLGVISGVLAFAEGGSGVCRNASGGSGPRHRPGVAGLCDRWNVRFAGEPCQLRPRQRVPPHLDAGHRQHGHCGRCALHPR